MSRRYCDVCKEPHSNGGLGLCDAHLAEKEERRAAEQNETAAEWQAFMALSEEDRWEKVFDFMRERGFKVWG